MQNSNQDNDIHIGPFFTVPRGVLQAVIRSCWSGPTNLGAITDTVTKQVKKHGREIPALENMDRRAVAERVIETWTDQGHTPVLVRTHRSARRGRDQFVVNPDHPVVAELMGLMRLNPESTRTALKAAGVQTDHGLKPTTTPNRPERAVTPPTTRRPEVSQTPVQPPAVAASEPKPAPAPPTQPEPPAPEPKEAAVPEKNPDPRPPPAEEAMPNKDADEAFEKWHRAYRDEPHELYSAVIRALLDEVRARLGWFDQDYITSTLFTKLARKLNPSPPIPMSRYCSGVVSGLRKVEYLIDIDVLSGRHVNIYELFTENEVIPVGCGSWLVRFFGSEGLLQFAEWRVEIETALKKKGIEYRWTPPSAKAEAQPAVKTQSSQPPQAEANKSADKAFNSFYLPLSSTPRTLYPTIIKGLLAEVRAGLGWFNEDYVPSVLITGLTRVLRPTLEGDKLWPVCSGIIAGLRKTYRLDDVDVVPGRSSGNIYHLNDHREQVPQGCGSWLVRFFGSEEAGLRQFAEWRVVIEAALKRKKIKYEWVEPAPEPTEPAAAPPPTPDPVPAAAPAPVTKPKEEDPMTIPARRDLAQLTDQALETELALLLEEQRNRKLKGLKARLEEIDAKLIELRQERRQIEEQMKQT